MGAFKIGAFLGCMLPWAAMAGCPGPSPYGRIGDLWNGLQAQLGCAVAPERDGPGPGRVQEFANGGIAFSPNVAPGAVHAVWRNGINVSGVIDVADWEYDFFIVRWDIDGRNAGQSDLRPGRGRSARFDVPVTAEGRYRVIVEGCDDRTIGGARCLHGWSNPIELAVDRSSYCPAYADDAVSKARTASSLGARCAVAGPRWTPDRVAHLSWCAQVPISRSHLEVAARDGELSRCVGALANPNVCTGVPCVPPPTGIPSPIPGR